jgi:hypothetical protein
VNSVALYLGEPLAYAYAHDGAVKACGSERFDSEHLAFAFAEWFGQQSFDWYNQIRIWAPDTTHPRYSPLFRYVIEKHPHKVRLVKPRELREGLGLPWATRRDYLRIARKRHATFKVNLVEEALCVLIAPAGDGDLLRPRPEPLHA